MGMPRARASMATWLVVLPRVSAMAPPPLQSVSRKVVGAMSSPTSTAPSAPLAVPSPERWRSTRSRMSREVGGAGAEVIIVGGLVAGDLAVERIGPRDMRGRAAIDGRQGRSGERIVFQHGHLKAENVLRFALDALHQSGKISNRLGDGVLQFGALAVPDCRVPCR